MVSGAVPPYATVWTLTDEVTFAAPIRRRALDGGSYDASPMVVKRAGVPWMTYYWGYRLGLVGAESNWSQASLAAAPALQGWPSFPSAANNFELATLPPPWVEGEVYEYVNTRDFPNSPYGQYFYAASVEERQLVDGVRGWQRTGLSFKAGGYVSVCRFYGSTTPGPNTHFFTASESECALLRSLQQVPTPRDRPQLNFEGYKFRASVPIAAATAGAAPTCPAATIPLYRMYNNASSYGYRFESNHRFSTRRDVVDNMIRDTGSATVTPWVDEGIVMCVPQ
jgi:hypothetical protein